MYPVNRLLSAEELDGILNHDDDTHFILDIKSARGERAEEILRNNWMKQIGEVNRDE